MTTLTKATSSRKIFDDVAEKYWQDNLLYNGVEYFSQMKQLISSCMVGDIADIGNGGLLHYDPTVPQQVTLVDISAAMLVSPRMFDTDKFVTVPHNNIIRINGDACRLPLDDESRDAVMLNNVAHHLAVSSLKQTDYRVKSALNELKRILRPGGRFILGENCPGPLFKILYRWAYFFLAPPFEKQNKPLPFFHSQDRLLQFLAEVGLEVDEVKIVLGQAVETGDVLLTFK